MLFSRSLSWCVAAFAVTLGVRAAEWTPKFYPGLEAKGEVRTVPGGYHAHSPCHELEHLSGGYKFGAEQAVATELSGPVDWTVEVEVLGLDGGEAQVGMEYFAADGTFISADLGETLKVTDWTKHEWKFHAPAKTAKATVQILSLAGGRVRFAQFKATARPGGAESLPLEAFVDALMSSRDWNGGKALFNSFFDGPLPLTFSLRGDRSQLKDPALEIDLPAQLRISDAFTVHDAYHRQENPTVSDVTHDGLAYRRFRFTKMNVFNILRTDYAWARQLCVIIEPEPNAMKSGKHRVYYRTADATRTGSEATFEISFTKLPTLRQPKNFPVMCWCDEDRHITRDDVLARTARAYEAAGCLSRRRYVSKFTRAGEIVRQLQSRNQGWFFLYGFNDLTDIGRISGPGFAELNVRHALSDSGEQLNIICPEFFLNDPGFRRYYENHVLSGLKDSGVVDGDWVTLDFEPWGAEHYCVCDTCLKKFAEFAGMAAPPPVKDVTDKDKYLDKWAQFRIRHCEQIIKWNCELVRRHNPKLKIVDYDYILLYGSGTEYLFYRGCAKDTKLNEKWFDMHCCSYYHVHDRRAFEAIRNNTRHLEKDYIPIAATEGSGGYLGKNEVRHPRQLRQLALAAFVHGCPGFALYSGKDLDGAQLYALMKARDEIAALEDLPWGKTEGVLKAVADDPELVFATTSKGGRELIALFNYNRKTPAKARVVSDSLRTGHKLVDPVSGEALAGHADLRKGFEIVVPADGVRFLEMHR